MTALHSRREVSPRIPRDINASPVLAMFSVVFILGTYLHEVDVQIAAVALTLLFYKVEKSVL